jgi:hypothetical protein
MRNYTLLLMWLLCGCGISSIKQPVTNDNVVVATVNADDDVTITSVCDALDDGKIRYVISCSTACGVIVPKAEAASARRILQKHRNLEGRIVMN